MDVDFLWFFCVSVELQMHLMTVMTVRDLWWWCYRFKDVLLFFFFFDAVEWHFEWHLLYVCLRPDSRSHQNKLPDRQVSALILQQWRHHLSWPNPQADFAVSRPRWSFIIICRDSLLRLRSIHFCLQYCSAWAHLSCCHVCEARLLINRSVWNLNTLLLCIWFSAGSFAFLD